jgi:hypothetical protein
VAFPRVSEHHSAHSKRKPRLGRQMGTRLLTHGRCQGNAERAQKNA